MSYENRKELLSPIMAKGLFAINRHYFNELDHGTVEWISAEEKV